MSTKLNVTLRSILEVDSYKKESQVYSKNHEAVLNIAENVLAPVVMEVSEWVNSNIIKDLLKLAEEDYKLYVEDKESSFKYAVAKPDNKERYFINSLVDKRAASSSLFVSTIDILDEVIKKFNDSGNDVPLNDGEKFFLISYMLEAIPQVMDEHVKETTHTLSKFFRDKVGNYAIIEEKLLREGLTIDKKDLN